MGFFDFWRKKQPETLTTNERQILSQLRGIGINTPGQLWPALMPDYRNESSGVVVNTTTALNLSAIYSALNISANSINLPVNVYRRIDNNNRELVTKKHSYEYQVYNLLHVSPNGFMTPSEFWGLMEWNRLLYGNGFAEIKRNGASKPTALIWHHPDTVAVKLGDSELYYEIRGRKGKIKAMDMIHVKNQSRDGYVGLSIIDIAADSLGFGLETQKAGNKYFKDGMTSKVVLSHPGILGTAAKKNLHTSFDNEMKEGSTVVLEEGLKPYLLTISPEQSQFLQSREFSVTEVARWFNLPEFMVANSDPTYSNVGSFSLHFVTHNVRPRVRLYEQEFNWKLLLNNPEFFTEYNLNALLRADVKTRYDVYGIAIQNRIMSPNEARAMESMNSYEGGDVYENPNVLSKQNEKGQEEETENKT